jgi:hypothetical protein
MGKYNEELAKVGVLLAAEDSGEIEARGGGIKKSACGCRSHRRSKPETFDEKSSDVSISLSLVRRVSRAPVQPADRAGPGSN